MMNNSTPGDSGRFYLKDEDCGSIFQIPSGLLESYGVNSPLSEVWLKVDESGKRWRVTIEKFKGCYFFTNGWKEFSEQVDLMSLAWLEFKHGTSKEKTRKKTGDVNVTTSSLQLSFTKIMKMDYYLKKLYIPRQFILDSGMQFPGEIKLKDSEGRVWPILLKHIAGVPTLGRGWSDFVKDNDVMVGSKVSFTWLSGNMLQARIVKEGELQDNVEGYGAEQIWSFRKNMKNHHQYSLEIPQNFARGIGLRKYEELKLRNGEGKEWPVGVTQRNKHGIFSMSRGWAAFVIDNKVLLGSKVLFTWLSGNTLQTQISEVGTDKQQLRSTAHWKRKRQ